MTGIIATARASMTTAILDAKVKPASVTDFDVARRRRITRRTHATSSSLRNVSHRLCRLRSLACNSLAVAKGTLTSEGYGGTSDDDASSSVADDSAGSDVSSVSRLNALL